MDIAALVAWLATAGGGLFLFGTWLSNGGMSRDEPTTSRFTPGLILGHAGLAAAGLMVWIAYLVSDENETLAWVALGLLVPVAVLGFMMFLRWLKDRRGQPTGSSSEIAEQRFPLVVVGAHGVLAVMTVVLVLIAALEATS